MNLIFIFQFSHGVLHPSPTGDCLLVRCVWNVFHVPSGRIFVFGLRTTKTSKNLKTFFNLSFFQP